MTSMTKSTKTGSGTASKTATRKSPARKTPVRKKAAGKSVNEVTSRLHPEMREQMIAVSAYYRAKGRSFIGGSDVQDWLAAEDEIDRLLINRV